MGCGASQDGQPNQSNPEKCVEAEKAEKAAGGGAGPEGGTPTGGGGANGASSRAAGHKPPAFVPAVAPEPCSYPSDATGGSAAVAAAAGGAAAGGAPAADTAAPKNPLCDRMNDVYLCYEKKDDQEFAAARLQKKDDQEFAAARLQKKDDQEFAAALRTFLAAQSFLMVDEAERGDEALTEAISTCRNVVVLLTDNFFDSASCSREMELAVEHRCNIIIVVKEGARWKDFNGELTALLPNRLALEKFPEATRPVFKQYKQLMHSAEHYEAFLDVLKTRVVTAPTYHVFLSYVRQEATELADELVKLMDMHHITTFRERLDLYQDQEVPLTMIRSCRNVVAILTDSYLSSPWCMKELEWALQAECNIVLVVQDGATWVDPTLGVVPFPSFNLYKDFSPEVRAVFKLKPVMHSRQYSAALPKILLPQILRPVREHRVDLLARESLAEAVSPHLSPSSRGKASGKFSLPHASPSKKPEEQELERLPSTSSINPMEEYRPTTP